MAFIFPEDKADFKAPNGVTYSWDGVKWRTKTYSGAEPDARLPYRLGTDKAARSARSGEPSIELVDAEDNFSNVKFFGVNGIECESTIAGIKIDGHQLIGSGDIDLTKYATIDYSDTEDHKLQLQIDELGVTKGKVARYTPKSIAGGFASRPGEVTFNSGDPAAVNQISFGTEDADNVLTKPMADGDIVEFVDAAAGNVSRYRISDASGAPTAVEVEYISGDNTFAVGQEEQVYIYPQNEAGATKEYVDAQDALRLQLTGGELSGPLRIKKGDEKTHPQWKVTPNGGTDYATNIYGLEGQMRLRTSHTGNEGDHIGSHIVLDPDVAGGGANPYTKIWKVPLPTSADMAASKAYVDQEVAAVGGGSDYTLPTASTGTKGGVKAATTGGTYVACTKMSGEVMGVVQSSSSVRGVNYKGQACITADSTPNAANFQQGALIFSTSTNSLFIRT